MPSLKQMEEECDEIKEHLETYENAVIGPQIVWEAPCGATRFFREKETR